VLTPVAGHHMHAILPPAAAAERLIMARCHAPSVPIELHPLVTHSDFADTFPLDECLKNLSGRPWPVGLMHGDFAPWNILVRCGDNATPIDWENGLLDGMPFLDLAHFILQSACLIYRWHPARALEYGARYLAGCRWAGITIIEARWLTVLAAHCAYQQRARDNQPVSTPIQSWLRSLWESVL
jgi:hypothetical protein